MAIDDNANYTLTGAQVKDLAQRVKSGGGTAYTAGAGITISNNEISVDSTEVPFLTTLATVAMSGSYNDLSDKPTIPAAQVNSDWNAASGVAQILNKPTLATVATSGSYNDLSNKPTIPAAQVQSNWTQTSTTAVDYIKNKPTIPTVNNATLTIQKNGTTVKTFTANASSNVTANITVPTKTQLVSGGTVTTTTTNLSQAPSNFDYLLVDIIDNDGRRASIWVPSGSPSFSYANAGYANGIYKKWSGWTISGSKITRAFSAEQFANNAAYDGSFHGIQRVFGIKIP